MSHRGWSDRWPVYDKGNNACIIMSAQHTKKHLYIIDKETEQREMLKWASVSCKPER